MMSGNSSVTDFLTRKWGIEESFDPLPWQQWMRKEGMVMWAVCTFSYLILVFRGPRLMDARPKYEMRAVLGLWNGSLALYSIISAWRLTIAAYELVRLDDFWHSVVCGADFYARDGYSSLWLFLFALSKVAEYGDTVFIVLRKSKLILLHWYHHIMTFLVGFHTFAYSNPTLFVSALMNVYVHSLMYSYYALRIAGVRVPKQLAMALTSIQIVQMIVGTYAQIYAMWVYLLGGRPCELGPFAVYAGTFGYATVCLLFIHFFFKTYLSKKPSKSDLERKDAKKES